VLAPVTPFVTEKIYQNLVRGLEPNAPESIHLAAYPQTGSEYDETLIKKIDTIIEIVSIGRAARNKVNIKVRQPLAKIFIKLPSGSDVAGLTDLSDQILEELNIKELEFITDESRFVNFQVKPNFALLGVKYGRRLGEIQKALRQQNPAEVARKIEQGGAIDLNLADEKVFLTGPKCSSNGKKAKVSRRSKITASSWRWTQN
jgi:isoleucyl-tRNA synthetase